MSRETGPIGSLHSDKAEIRRLRVEVERLRDPRPVIIQTLRAAAQWFPGTRAAGILMWVADDVERGGDVTMRCPVCEEVVCGDDCPLEGFRAALTEQEDE